jgi:hypothetical protein
MDHEVAVAVVGFLMLPALLTALRLPTSWPGEKRRGAWESRIHAIFALRFAFTILLDTHSNQSLEAALVSDMYPGDNAASRATRMDGLLSATRN